MTFRLHLFFIILLLNVFVLNGQIKSSYFQFPEGITEADCEYKTLVAKLKPQYNSLKGNLKSDAILDKAFEKLSVYQSEPIFPHSQPPAQKRDVYGRTLVDLTAFYRLQYSSEKPMEEVIALLLSTGRFEYVEPVYPLQLFYVPNDPMQATQYALRVIKAYDAWTVTQGDTNVVIGISDTGVELTHPDLKNNIKYNWLDPIDGVDNDNDGYVDNFRGWDMADWDNNPSFSGNCSHDAHGTLVAGLASASTDNGIGIAGTGFKCKILPIKIFSSNTCGLMRGYESIVYAVDHGCQIVNCSWGGGAYSRYGQDIINYASINRNALVVCAAGNSGTEIYYYPASFDNVISVAFTDSLDLKQGNTTYNDKIDVCAPGEAVLTTGLNGTYTPAWASSMASPVAAGVAAIIKSRYPNFIGLQLGELLKVTADVIDTISQNLPFQGKLGTGRVNMYKAVTQIVKPSLDIASVEYYDTKDSIIVNNDTVLIKLGIINYLAPASDVRVFLNSSSPYIAEFINPWAMYGAIGMMETKVNSNNPFRIKLGSTPLTNQKIKITATIVDGSNTFVKTFEIEFNKDYVDVDVNHIATTVASTGRMAYTDLTMTRGVGFTYDGSATLTSLIGVLAANSATNVSDVIFNSTNALDNDFKMMSIPYRYKYSPKADAHVVAHFNDTVAGLNRVGIDVIQNVYAWSNPEDAKYILSEYVIRNTTNSTINNFYFGLYSDWDILDYQSNRAAFDYEYQLGYVTSIYEEYYTGIKLLSHSNVRYYAMDNDGANGSIALSQLTSGKKYTMMKGGRYNAGSSGNGNDVSHYLGTGPLTIPAGDSVKIAFALLAGTSLADIQIGALAATNKYWEINVPKVDAENADVLVFPNPAENFVKVKWYSKNNAENCEIRITDLQGRIVQRVIVNIQKGWNEAALSIEHLQSGLYFIQLPVASAFSYKLSILH